MTKAKYGSIVRVTKEELLRTIGYGFDEFFLVGANFGANCDVIMKHLEAIHKSLQLPEEVEISEIFFENRRDIVCFKLRSEEVVEDVTYAVDEGMAYPDADLRMIMDADLRWAIEEKANR